MKQTTYTIYIDTNIDSIYFKRNKNIKVIIDSTYILLTYSNFEVLVDFLLKKRKFHNCLYLNIIVVV